MNKKYIKPATNVFNVTTAQMIAESLGFDADIEVDGLDALSGEDFGWEDDDFSSSWKRTW